ncbi:DUF3038 domain-containing protein [Lyngbya sp. CCY1209]|uniref:DUF3038 domain-containing protein n=1 Tax=Lyngbya sp. CCY1209 TaxID=2886103 RepID=UPI002D1FEE5A|nr:DUF3038 domain-containing protein [Lyngbya sp. CCY1209]MEB3884353.1 DUF3038 domain-containing protein [Lyngbya sp. CCY1209]
MFDRIPPHWRDLKPESDLTPKQLDRIALELTLNVLALEALAGVTSDTLLRTAKTLNLETEIAEQWQAKTPTIEGVRSLVLIVCHLAKHHQALLRRAIALVEQMEAQNDDLRQISLLRDYLDTFIKGYRERFPRTSPIPEEELTPFALKLLIDLLFYSGPDGSHRCWSALLERSQTGDRS